MRPLADYEGSERFEIIRRIGAGGMGVVYEAFDRERGSRVALKTLPQIRPHRLYLFKNEFRSLAGIAHRNLVTLYELLGDGDRWFFTMEVVEGTDFLRYVTQTPAAPDLTPPSEETLTLALSARSAEELDATHSICAPDYDRLREALAQVVRGLAALHADGKVHRDVKPSNVLVTPEGRAVILDFGLVQDVTAEVTEEGAGAGSAAYMSPEQCAGEVLDPTTDFYSTGVMLYQALTGRLPSRSDIAAPRTIVPSTPDDLNALCVALLDHDRTRRPGAAEILASLRRSGPKTARAEAEKRVFVGRQRELETLDEAFEKMRRGEAVVLTIEGASGLGKSALLRECARRFRDRNAAVLSGRCYEQESVPYKVFDQAIDGLTSYFAEAPRDRSGRSYASRCGSVGRCLSRPGAASDSGRGASARRSGPSGNPAPRIPGDARTAGRSGRSRAAGADHRRRPVG